MPMGSVILRPGVNTEKTLSLNEAGVSQSQLLRYKDGLLQAQGGWVTLYSLMVPSTVRDLHAWQDITDTKWLAAGATANLLVISSSTSIDITPQTRTTNPAPNFSVTTAAGNQFIVSIVDANSGPSIYDTVFFNTPISIGNLYLNGAYPITSVLSTGSYTIQSSVAASTTIVSSGILPVFLSSAGSPIVTVIAPNNPYQAILGLEQSFYAPTTVDGLTISGGYVVTSIVAPSSTFTITATQLASANATSTMNGGLAQLVYYVTAGPQTTGAGFGTGGFGLGGFGTGVATTGTPGTPIMATDWSLDNWGEILLACPKDGAIYAWSADSGFGNAQVVPQAPFFNGGIFVSQPQQILVAWESVQSSGTQNNLVVRWSNAGDFTNWDVTSQTTAGSFTIPTGSVIIGGLQAPNFGVIWTDIDVWIMSYVGGDVIFNFSRVGAGCGLIGQHAANIISGTIYWCGTTSFFMLGPNGVVPVPCTVWDFIFQNLNAANQSKVQCAPNSAFNEIAWFFPSTSSTENDSYVRLNIVENAWDYGSLKRTAWIDVSVLGTPIGTDNSGAFLQHEVGQVTAGASATSFRSGWFSIADGNELAFVDWVLPDFQWGLFGDNSAQVNMTFYVIDYPGDTPRSYGPYTLTQATQYINPRFRGRLMSVQVQSNNSVFWRIGRVRFRHATSGRR
jgi:hypothetical protein